jgi:hypothetical protein
MPYHTLHSFTRPDVTVIYNSLLNEEELAEGPISLRSVQRLVSGLPF